MKNIKEYSTDELLKAYEAALDMNLGNPYPEHDHPYAIEEWREEIKWRLNKMPEKINWLGLESRLKEILTEFEDKMMSQGETIVRIDETLAAFIKRGNTLSTKTAKDLIGAFRLEKVQEQEWNI